MSIVYQKLVNIDIILLKIYKVNRSSCRATGMARSPRRQGEGVDAQIQASTVG